ncbi:guanylate kinase [Alkalithermobacter paradoxus]|uniref:Guanylate kinase n=1 Tax=Alkalithermobacter paradoxus TaxID=29349 RepID=A0A1V4IA81_9FIRM|nr:guanylate kinase [[Clostridium] thermoalcaliphilum]
MNREGLLIVVSGPSGAGKGTICKELLNKNKEIKISVSATTRNPREGEVDGVNYFFISKEKFENMIEQEEFLEYARVYDNFYGTPKKAVLDTLSEGRDVLLEIDIQGAMQVKEKYPKGVFIFILPPSLKELKDRIVKRGTETEEDISKRFGCAISEIEKIENYDYFIINKDVERAVYELQSIISSEKNKVARYKENIIKQFKEEL